MRRLLSWREGGDIHARLAQAIKSALLGSDIIRPGGGSESEPFVEGDGAGGVGDAYRGMINAETGITPWSGAPLGRDGAGRKAQKLQRVAVGIAELERGDMARGRRKAFWPIG